MVLPRPISSARMQLFPLGKNESMSDEETHEIIHKCGNLSINEIRVMSIRKKPNGHTCTKNGPSSSDPPTDSPAAPIHLRQCSEAASSWVQTVASVLKPKGNPTFNWLDSRQFHLLAQMTGVECRYLAVSGGSGFALIATHVFINALLKLSGNKSAIFPAALGVWQPLPFTKVIW